MPTYQYACTACGHQLEAVQSFADEPLTQCPACEGRLRKLFSSVGIVFKGSGFYRTDSRGSTAEPGSGGTKESGGEAPAAKPGSDAKPAKPVESGAAKPADKPASPAKPATSAA